MGKGGCKTKKKKKMNERWTDKFLHITTSHHSTKAALDCTSSAICFSCALMSSSWLTSVEQRKFVSTCITDILNKSLVSILCSSLVVNNLHSDLDNFFLHSWNGCH